MTKEQAIQELERFNREGRIFATSVHEAIDIAIKTIKEKDKKLEKKDKMIDLMAKTISNNIVITYFNDAENVKRYYEKLVKTKSEQL